MLNINCHCYGMLDHITNEVNSLLSQIINAEKGHQDLKEFDIKTKFNIINHERNFQIT